MKYLLITMSGAADQPCEELGEKTPLEVAKIPNLNSFAKNGKVGQAKLYSDRFEPSSDVTFLSALGYDADKVYTGLGPLEAANLELKLEDNEIAFRMNFITEAEGLLADETGGNLTTKEAKALINFLNKKVASDFVRFFPGTFYKHIAVLKDSHGFEALSARTVNPEFVVGEKLESNFPKGPGEELLKKLMFDARLLLQDHEINQVRVDLGENPANMIWLWGQGRKPVFEKFFDRNGVSGALVANLEYAKGVGRLAGLTVREVESVPDNPELDYDRRAKAVFEALNEKDFVCLHLEACDEASRLGDLKAKVSAIEAIDYFLMSRIKEYVEQHKEIRLIVTPCHVAPWKSGRHVRETVPFLISGKNIMPDDIEKFSEVAAKTSELKMGKGADLLPFFLAK